jgi:hypothetical protein
LLGERPEILLSLLGLTLPEGATVSLASAEFTQAVPAERRADAVIVVEEQGMTTSAFVVEVQLAVDPDKHFSWPLYLASLHARTRCPTHLVIFAADRDVAAWSRRPIPTLSDGRGFAPIVLGPDEIPRITSRRDAEEAPELAVLSALVHGAEPDAAGVVDSALHVVAQLDDPHAKNYYDLIYSTLGDVARTALEALMSAMKYEYRSDFAKKYVAQGRIEGLAQGRIEGARRTLFAILESRGIVASDDTRARVDACADPDALERWVVRAASATSERDLFDDG